MVAPFVDKNPSQQAQGPEVRDLDLHAVPDACGRCSSSSVRSSGVRGSTSSSPGTTASSSSCRSRSRGYRHRHRRRRGPRGHRPRRDGSFARHDRSAEPGDAQARHRRRSVDRHRGRSAGRRDHRGGRDGRGSRARRRGPQGDRVGQRARCPSRVRPAPPSSTSRSTSTSSASPAASSSTVRSSPVPVSGSARSASPRWRSSGRRPVAASAARSSWGRRPTPRTPSTTRSRSTTPAAKTYIVAYPKDDLPKAKKVPRTPRRSSPGWRRATSPCTRSACTSGCRVPWCPSSQWFECPCHGSKYNRVGEKQGGPAPRGLDRFALEVSGGNIIVDTGLLVTGPPIGTEHHRTEPRGSALCLSARHRA